MPTQTPGNPALFPESAPLYDDGDEQVIATVNVALEALLDRTAWLKARTSDPLLVPLFSGHTLTGSSAPAVGFFVPKVDDDRIGWLQDAVDPVETGGIVWHVQVSTAVEIASIVASLNGDDGPGTNTDVPAEPDRPRLVAYRQPTDGSSKGLLGSATDTSTTKAAYEQHHQIALAGESFPVQLAAGEYLVLIFYGHRGPNVGASTLKLYGLEIVLDLP